MSRPSDTSPGQPPGTPPGEPEAPSCTVSIEVRYAETDQMRVVHHANYVVWFEQARTELCKQSGFHYAEIEELGYLLTVTKVELRYLQPARYGDVVEVECRLERLASRLLAFGYSVRRGGDELARGSTEHIWCRADTGKPCRTPEPLREPFSRLVSDSLSRRR